MSRRSDGFLPVSDDLAEQPVEELLLLIGDAAKGRRAEAMGLILKRGLEEIYPSLEAAVRDDANADLRNGAMEVLVKFGKPAVARLLVLLHDRNEEVRNFSAVMLGEIGSREAAGHLVQALSDPDANVKQSAAEALGKIGDQSALKSLVRLLDDDFWLQYPAIVALAKTRDSRAVPHLLQLLANEMLTGPVTEALGKIGDPRALPHLGRLLSRPDGAFTAEAAGAIVAIRKNLNEASCHKNRLSSPGQEEGLADTITRQGIENLKNLLRGENPEADTDCAIQLLGWLGEVSAIPDFVRLLERNHCVDTVEGAIVALGKPAVHYLLPALSHPSPCVKVVALRSLRWLGGVEDHRILAGFLSGEPEEVQLEALELLKGASDEVLLPQLLRLMATGSAAVRTRALEVVCRYPDKRVRSVLEELRISAGPRHRQSAALLIGFADSGIPFDSLAPLLADPAAEVRKEAVRAAGRRKFVESVPLLVQVLSDADEDLREEAIDALGEFGESAPLPDLLQSLGRGNERTDHAIIGAIGRIGSGKAGARLAEYLDTGKAPQHIEFAVIDAFGKLGKMGANECRLVAGYLRHQDPDMRRLAVHALANMAEADALPLLAEACKDGHWSVRMAALQESKRVGGEKAVPALLDALSDRDSMVRGNAILLMGELRDVRTIYELVKQLTDPEMSGYAFDALLIFGRTALPWLHRIMKGDYFLDTRERVIELIGKIGERRSVEPLLDMIEDERPDIRLAAIDSLMFCCDSLPLKKLSYVQSHDADEEVRNKAALALKTLAMEKVF